MSDFEIRDPREARDFLFQGLCLQRVISPPTEETVRPALEWAREVVSRGHSLPPLGFVADVGHVAFALDWETRRRESGVTPPLPAVPPHLLPTYEDQVLGKLYADWTFSRACEALRGYYKEGRDRGRALAFVLRQFCERSGYRGVELSPGVITAALEVSPAEVLRQGYESLQEGPHPALEAHYESLIAVARRMSEVLGQEDVLELESGAALAEEGERLAFRQVVRAALALENGLPRHKVRPLARPREVPTRVLDEDTYPVGGFSSLSNRGSIESLLHSQLAYIEDGERPDLFDVKYLRDELLYYSRDENNFLRRRRAFVLALFPDLVEKVRFKDADLPWQRGILMLAMLFVLVRKLSEWLCTDSLTFDFVFIIPPGRPRPFPLKAEFELLARLLREQAANGTVAFAFLFISPAGADESTESLKARVREQVPRGTVRFQDVPSAEGLADLCSRRARRSLCHCLTLATRNLDLSAQDTVLTQLRVSGPRPALGEMGKEPLESEGDEAMEAWCAALHQLLQQWV